MLRADKIQSALFGGVGFRQSTLTGLTTIVDATNLASSSGLYFQDASFLVTIKNIKDTQENPDISDADFNLLLKHMQESVILDVCNKVMAQQSDYIQSSNLYPYEKTFDTTLSVSDQFNVFRITPNYKNNYISKISFIELCFDSAKTFNIYLYNSNKPNTPIETQSVTTVANESVIVDLNWFISDDTSYKGGVFYLGYFEDDLGGALPIARNFELSSLGKSTRCFYIEPVKLNHTSSLIDVSNYTNQSDTGGLNIGVEIYNDYTEFIIKNKNLFWQLIQTEMAIKVLNLIVNTTRSNRTERISGSTISKALVEVHGADKDGIKIEGLSVKSIRLIADLKKTLFYEPRIKRRTLS